MSSLMMCLGQGVVVQRKWKEKECVVEDIRNKSSHLGGRVDETNQEVDNLKRQVLDWKGKLVKLAALEAAFDHFTNRHWISLQAIIISLHNSLCWTCRGDGQSIPDQVRSALAPPSLSIAIPIPPPHSGQRLATPGPPPLSPITDDDSSIISDSSTDSSPNPFCVERRTFQAAHRLDGLIWTKEERAALQAFLSHYTSKEGVNVTILEAGEGDRSPGGSRMLSEGSGFGEGVAGAWHDGMSGLLGSGGCSVLQEEQVPPQSSSPSLPSLAELLLSGPRV